MLGVTTTAMNDVTDNGTSTVVGMLNIGENDDNENISALFKNYQANKASGVASERSPKDSNNNSDRESFKDQQSIHSHINQNIEISASAIQSQQKLQDQFCKNSTLSAPLESRTPKKDDGQSPKSAPADDIEPDYMVNDMAHVINFGTDKDT